MKVLFWALGVFVAAFLALTAYTAVKLVKVGESVDKNFRETADAEKNQGKTSGGTVIEEKQSELEEVRDAQLKKLLELGFHKAAGLTEEEFSALVPVPDSKDAILVVNENCVGILTQCKLLNVSVHVDFDIRDHWNMNNNPKEKMYWRYDMDDGWMTIGMSVFQARDFLIDEKKRQTATTRDVLAIYRQKPCILKRYGMHAAGSGYGGSRCPHLSLKNCSPELYFALSDRIRSEWGSPSFGK